jgi:hypothetical protein
MLGIKLRLLGFTADSLSLYRLRRRGSKILKIKIYRTIVWLVVFVWM